MAYKSFEDLEVWTKAVELCVQVYREFKSCRDFGFKDQICRAAVSVPSNIAEGMERDSKKETIRFLHIAKASCAECRTQLLIASKVDYLEKDGYDQLKREAESISRMLHGLIRSIKP